MIYKSLKTYLSSSCMSGGPNTSAATSSSNPSPIRRSPTSHRASASTAITGTSNAARQTVQFTESARRRGQVAAPVKIYVRHTTDVKKSHVAVTLPRHLVKPAYRDVDSQALKAVDPELENVPVQYLKDGLRLIGARMLSVLAQTVAAPVSSKIIPREIQVTVCTKDSSAAITPPTHVLAIYNSQPSASSSSRRVMLVPTHSVVLAAHCASLPHFPASPAAAEGGPLDEQQPESESTNEAGPPCPSSSSMSYTVPVVPMGIPSPETFVPLSSYLYNGRADQLFNHFMPCSPDDIASLLPSASTSESELDPETSSPTAADLTSRLATSLSKSLTPHQLLQHAMRINGLWRNVCALGIYDEALWKTMEVMWDVVVGAMGVGMQAGRT